MRIFFFMSKIMPKKHESVFFMQKCFFVENSHIYSMQNF